MEEIAEKRMKIIHDAVRALRSTIKNIIEITDQELYHSLYLRNESYKLNLDIPKICIEAYKFNPDTSKFEPDRGWLSAFLLTLGQSLDRTIVIQGNLFHLKENNSKIVSNMHIVEKKIKFYLSEGGRIEEYDEFRD